MIVSNKSLLNDISSIGTDIREMTVSEIAEHTGKTQRAIKIYLTRNSISCLDYGTNTDSQKVADMEEVPKLGSKTITAQDRKNNNESKYLIKMIAGILVIFALWILITQSIVGSAILTFISGYILHCYLDWQKFKADVLIEIDEESALSAEELLEKRHGRLNKKLVCPHCQTAGFLRVQPFLMTDKYFHCMNCESHWTSYVPPKESNSKQGKSTGIIFPIE
jgi:hypothetical protein